MTRVAVVGTGLIGGSILLRLAETARSDAAFPGSARSDAELDVCGWDPDPGTRREGRGRGLVFADELVEAVREADVVFLCGPLPTLPETLATVTKSTGDGCVITDVGSTKSALATYAVEHGLADRFVPGHPMSGTERAGLTAAAPELLRGAAWVLCPPSDAPLDHFRTLAALLVRVFEAKIVPMSPVVHDSAAALASHIPHLLAGSLAGAVARSPLRDAVLGLAAGSFRDGTRVAGAPSRRTADMVINNRDAVLRQLGAVQEFLAALADAVRDDDVEALQRRYAEGRGLREALLDRRVAASVRRFPRAGSSAGNGGGAGTGTGGAERDFLLALGESGGYLTGCAVEPTEVVYAACAPER
ncbi:prephenate dehydrogenase/arogenate dehydrogenase family protein [Micromonospora sp. NPDC049559]|uniref:prephenate dehydrogenase n=1 Tax=Micromonospora sp. NPDC049559 TaxID=3155923 RepID=UPI003425F486